MATTTITAHPVDPAVEDDTGLVGPLSVNIKPILESVAGKLTDGTRAEPDLSWLSPEQVAGFGPVLPRTVTVCPAFVGEIMSETDRLPPLQRKMERYMANGAQLGWLIDPYRRRVHVYRPGVDVEVLKDPETVSADPVMAGFVFEVRQRIFALYDSVG